MAELVNRQLISARVVVSRVPTALPVVRPHQSSSARYKTCPDQWFMVESAIPSATVQSVSPGLSIALEGQLEGCASY